VRFTLTDCLELVLWRRARLIRAEIRLKGVKAIAACLGHAPDYVGLLMKLEGFPVTFEGRLPVSESELLKAWAAHYLGQVSFAVPERIETREAFNGG
jgi:hypothetical protein